MNWFTRKKNPTPQYITQAEDPNILKPPRDATIALLNHAQGQAAIWDTEVARLTEHLRKIDAYEATRAPAPGIVRARSSA